MLDNLSKTLTINSIAQAMHVPRVQEMTAQKSVDDTAAEREWMKARKQFQADRARYGYKTAFSKQAWKRTVDKTRSV